MTATLKSAARGGRTPEFGERAPMFNAATDANPDFNFGSVAGRWIVLAFLGSVGADPGRAAHARVLARRMLFDDAGAAFFGVSADLQDRAQERLRTALPGLRYFWDFDRPVAGRYGVADADPARPSAFLLDPSLRVVEALPLSRIDTLLDTLERRLGEAASGAAEPFAPVLTVPRIFEPAFCTALIEHFEARGGTASGFMIDQAGVTVRRDDIGKKRRKDVVVQDERLRAALRARLNTRLAPLVEQAFGWRPTRIERYVLSCYSSHESGFFLPHRDNTTAGTAHRKFAVTLNLNAQDYDGGELRFPEFGQRTYKPPTGGATVFSCSLLHEATPVTRGLRYAFLPFLYDEQGQRLRERAAGAADS